MTRPKILTLDIETAPLEVHAWGLWKQNVGLNQIITEWSVLSYSAKWLGQKTVHYKDNRGRADVRDDFALMTDLHAFIDEADIIVAQNGQRFDMRKIRARMILLGFMPPSPVKVVDTMIEAKKLFAFTSNRLAWLSQYLSNVPKSEHREFPGFELWLECLKDNPRAWAVMKKYNRVDVLSTEEVYLRLRPWIIGHPNVAVYTENEEIACPYCGSTEHIKHKGSQFTQVGQYKRYHCVPEAGGCGGWARDRYTINSKAKRKSLLSN